MNPMHLTRVTDNLRMTSRAEMSRTTSLHVTLDHLTPVQFRAAIDYGRLRGHNSRIAGDRPTSTPLAWVPVGLISRSLVAPITIRDNENTTIHQAPQSELIRLLDSGLYSILRMALEASPESHDRSTPLFQFLHGSNEARWLVQTGVQQILSNSSLLHTTQRSAAERDLHPSRKLALEILDRHLDTDLRPFMELLSHAASSYLVVVGLDSRKKEHMLSYEAPVLPAGADSAVNIPLRRLSRGLLPAGREFIITYHSSMPRGLDDYHVTLEVDPRLRVREAILAVDHEEPSLRRLVSDLENLATLQSNGAMPQLGDKFIEYELQDAFTRLSTMIRSRRRNWQRYLDYVQVRQQRGQLGPDVAPTEPAWFTRLHEVEREFAQGRLTRLRTSPQAQPETLRDIAAQLQRQRFHQDAAFDDDPREHTAHVYWRQRHPSGRPAASEACPVHASFVIADDEPSLANAVLKSLAVLVGVVAAMYIGLFGLPAVAPGPIRWVSSVLHGGGPAPDGSSAIQADALVAVLFLVPGALVARLSLPRTNTLVGQVHLLPRWIALVAAATTAGLGLLVAIHADAPELLLWPFHVALAMLLGLFGYLGLEQLNRARKGRAIRLPVIPIPPWLTAAADDLSGFGRRRVDASFFATGEFGG